MNFVVLKRQPRVSVFFILNNLLLLKKQTGELVLDDNIIEADVVDVFAKNSILCANKRGNALIYDIRNEAVQSLQGKIVVSYIEKIVFIEEADDSKLFLYEVGSEFTRLLVDNYEWEVIFTDTNYFVLYKKDEVRYLKYEDILTDRSLSISPEIISVLGIVDDVLWLAKKEKNIHRLLGLDILNGSIKHDNENLIVKYAYSARRLSNSDNFLCIHGFSRYEPETEYKEVNGLTGEVIRTGVVQSLFEQKLVLKDWEKFGEHIYFTAAREEKFPTHIGVLDYNTLELVHWQKVELEEGCYLPAGKAPVVSDNKLYILDTGGTLHIYQID